MGKQRVVRIHGMKYSWKGHKDRSMHNNRIKRSGQARLVYVKDINCNIPPREGEPVGASPSSINFVDDVQIDENSTNENINLDPFFRQL